MNVPLSSNEQTKVALFFLSLLPTLGLGGGGFLIVAYGLYMLNKQADSSFIEVMRKLFTGYSKIACVIILFVSVTGAYHNYVRVRDDIQKSSIMLEHYTKEREEDRSTLTNEVIVIYSNTVNTGYSDYVIEVLLPAFIAPIIPILYIWMLHSLFYTPLSKHKEWVAANGIFSTTPVEPKHARTTPWISFGKTASIADELIKLNSLKEANIITVDEFNTLRSKLLS